MDEADILRMQDEELVKAERDVEMESLISRREKEDELEAEKAELIARWSIKYQTEMTRLEENFVKELERRKKIIEKDTMKRLAIIGKSKEKLNKIEKSKEVRQRKAEIQQKKRECIRNLNRSLQENPDELSALHLVECNVSDDFDEKLQQSRKYDQSPGTSK